MAKKHITYNDPEGSAPKVEFHGVPLIAGEPTEVDENHPIVAAAEAHPHFEVGAKRFSGSTAYKQGVKAGEDDEDRRVPEKLRGTAEESHWLAGYDDGAKGGAPAPVVDHTAIAIPHGPNSGDPEPLKVLQAGNRTTSAKPSR